VLAVTKFFSPWEAFMEKWLWVAAVALIGLTSAPRPAVAAGYTVNCGSGGPSSLIQQQLNAIAGTTGNVVTITGTCSGDLTVSNFDGLYIANLVLAGNLFVNLSKSVSFNNPVVTGTVSVSESRTTSFFGAVVNGLVQVFHGSSSNFRALTVNPWTDATGQVQQGFLCLGQSECTLDGVTLRGAHVAAPGAKSTGVLAASASRLTLTSGTISGFDWGVMVWNNATAFLTPTCDNLSVNSNGSIGVRVSDSGVVKIESLDAASASITCPGRVSIAGNGTYGVLAEGGGNAYLFGVQISGHSVDGIRVQGGSQVKVRSSTIDAATTSGRSARVRIQALLWFDEQDNGPSAKSVLAGPVCVTGNSSVDTENSATVVRIERACAAP
jgi:hypothetical protein